MSGGGPADFPAGSPVAGLTAQGDPYGEVDVPELLDHNVAPSVIEPTIAAVRSHFTGLHDYPHRVSAHMDGYTPDRHPVVGPLPEAPNVIVLGGFSGHGFKMSRPSARSPVT